MIAVLEDTQRLQLLQLDLSALTVAESVLRTSVSAVISVSTYDHTTDNYISATSSSKSTDYYKQAQAYSDERHALRDERIVEFPRTPI